MPEFADAVVLVCGDGDDDNDVMTMMVVLIRITMLLFMTMLMTTISFLLPFFLNIYFCLLPVVLAASETAGTVEALTHHCYCC